MTAVAALRLTLKIRRDTALREFPRRSNIMLAIAVVYTPKGNNGEIIRLISARKATKSEKEAYYNADNTYC